jgi:hypothetical protein
MSLSGTAFWAAKPKMEKTVGRVYNPAHSCERRFTKSNKRAAWIGSVGEDQCRKMKQAQVRSPRCWMG